MPLGPDDARGADLRHVETWLFDLDNTLYPEALALQKRYLAEHGLTLRGLMTHHGVDPDVYHATFHDVPLDCLEVDEALKRALARLPGRRLIFTNSDDVHTGRVVEALGLTGLFDAVFHIGSADFAPKPSPLAFQRILAAHDIDPAVTAFFEDSEHNLEPAAALGMTTVLVGAHAAASTAPFVRYRTATLAPFLAGAQVKETI
jgi:putative hydrolase of the HAD superfamily